VSIRTQMSNPLDSTPLDSVLHSQPTFGLKPWPFYMVFSLFICPSIGRLAILVGVAISTKVLTKGAVMGNDACFGSCEQKLVFVAREG